MGEIELHRDKKSKEEAEEKENFFKFILKVTKTNSYKLKIN